MICAGIDAGSRTIKAVLVDADGRLLASAIADQGVRQEQLARQLLTDLLREHQLEDADLARTVATGYGRHSIGFADTTVTEITCHARGVRHLVPEARTVIDIGGQDSKLILLNADGTVTDFTMNDRCAAGTGCFLEVLAKRLQVPLAELGAMTARARHPAAISSMCVVFAETEIIGLLAAGTDPEDIAAGVQRAIAGRIGTMAARKAQGPVIFTGGVARVGGMDEALEFVLGQPVALAPDPQLTGALGAALCAAGG